MKCALPLRGRAHLLMIAQTPRAIGDAYVWERENGPNIRIE